MAGKEGAFRRESHCGRLTDARSDEDSALILSGCGGPLLPKVEDPVGCPISPTVQGHPLSPGDQAALNGLITLAGALGVGTVFALFFRPRRKAPIAVFEGVVIVAVLTAAVATVYACINLLDNGKAIGKPALTEAAMPLAVATIILAIVSVVSRVPRPFGRGFPVLCVAVVGAAVVPLLVLWALVAEPSGIRLASFIILGGGLVAAVIAWGAEWLYLRYLRRDGHSEHRWVERRLRQGYVPGKRRIGLVLPAGDGDAHLEVGCWEREGKTYLDFDAFRRLRREADERWLAFSKGNATLVGGRAVLFRVDLDRWIPLITPKPLVTLVVGIVNGERETWRLVRTTDGLFEVG